MLHIGLTGGFATGKSVVGQELQALGCYVIRMDDLGHEVLAPQGEAYAAVVAEFGPEIVKPDGTIDRRALAQKAFADPALLKRLNDLTHPAIRARAAALRDAYVKEHPDAITVTEAAILIETGGYKNCDRLVLAHCRSEQQIERAMERDGLTREEVVNRISRQMPLEDKKKFANYVIDTSGTKESTLEQTRAVYEVLQKLNH
jgi:dephospho-CoA kinase